jgi:hypothetical protein
MVLRTFLSIMLIVAARPALAECRLCVLPSTDSSTERARPLTIEVESSLDFSRAAGTSTGGTIDIDARSGQRRVIGLGDLGGMALKGVVRLTGEPFRLVRVHLPASARLVSPDGSSAEAAELQSDLPPSPALDSNGVLVFTFGGRLVISGSTSGDFRGRIAITADYQ